VTSVGTAPAQAATGSAIGTVPGAGTASSSSAAQPDATGAGAQPSTGADEAAAPADETATRHSGSPTAVPLPFVPLPSARVSAATSTPAPALAPHTVAVVDGTAVAGAVAAVDEFPPPADDPQAADRDRRTGGSPESIVLQPTSSTAIPSALRVLVKTGATPLQRAVAATGAHPERSSLPGARSTGYSHVPGTGPTPSEPKPAAPTDNPQPFPPLPGSPAGASSGAVGGGGAGSPTIVAALTAAVLVIALELWLAVAISSGVPVPMRRPLLLDRPG
jgi:hypothetical protein